MITVSKLRNIIIGRLEDGGVQIVRIDCTEWSEAYPNLTYYRIEVTSPNGLVYIPVTRMEGNVLIWPITQSNTATSGEGMYQVVATGADGEQKTSDHPKLYILPVMPGTAQETPPAPSQPWVDQVLNAAERAEESADKAETASAHSPVISEGGTWLLWDADAGAYVDSGVKAVGRDGQPGKDAVVDATLTQSGQAADAKATGDALACKLTEPSEGLAVGRYFRIASLDASGHAVLEAVDAKTVGVQDVQVAGASVVADGVANVPVATNTKKGLVQGRTNAFGVEIFEGVIKTQPASQYWIDNRFSSDPQPAYRPLVPVFADSFVKAAMCDGKGATWTDAERISALLRMGCTVDDNGFVKWGASE